MKLIIKIHMVYSGYAYRVHYNNEYVVGGLLVRGWTLKQVIHLSEVLIKDSNHLNNQGHTDEQTKASDSTEI